MEVSISNLPSLEVAPASPLDDMLQISLFFIEYFYMFFN